jgi:ABC-type lipoprotein release transport system permease subunit
VGALFAAYLEAHLNANLDSGSSAIRLAAGRGLLIAIGLLAVVSPARRALRVDTLETLRDS